MKHLYTIMYPDVAHLDEICEDIHRQYEMGVATCALFEMTLVPEGNPPADKASILCNKYDLFRDKLSAMGIPNGVLVQASIGHGWVLGEMFPFQRYIGFGNGQAYNVVCPYDEGFRQYIYGVMQTIARHSPDHIMLDDDFRLMLRDGGGCACPLHMKRFNELAGTSMTREELLEVTSSDTEESRRYAEIFIRTQEESLLETAKIMRAGIDSVDPSLPGSFCCVGNNAENGASIAKIMAGEGNPVVVRINNGNYTPAGARYFSSVFFRAAAQIAKLRDQVDVILAETDTCPQNRYSTGAMSLHTHFTGTILEGAMGAKHWITRLSSFEPESGRAYRKILSRYRGFYDTVSSLLPSLRWRGCRIPVLNQPLLKLKGELNGGEDIYSGWGNCVLERLGLPMYFSAENGGVLCLEGDIVKQSDDEILEALKGPVLLASDSALALIQRGFGQYLGVDVRTWQGMQPSGEQYISTDTRSAAQMKIKELVPNQPETQVDSIVYNTIDSENRTPLFPGSTIYKNKLGGTIFTFAGTPRTNYILTEAFSYLNYSRKQQLIRMLQTTNELPAYYPNDEEVYLRVADMDDGGLFCAVFNLGLDPIEELEMVFNRPIFRIEKVMPDGTLRELTFGIKNGVCVMDSACYTLDPVVLLVH